MNFGIESNSEAINDYERLALLRMRRYLVRLFTLSKMAAVNKRKRCNEVLEAMKANGSASEDDVLNENEENYVERATILITVAEKMKVNCLNRKQRRF